MSKSRKVKVSKIKPNAGNRRKRRLVIANNESILKKLKQP